MILGNAGNNILDGGAGADDMQGGLGDDTYVVDRSDDLVTEEFNSGTDTVVASAGFILSDHIENLVLSGNGNFAGTGNALSNVLTGNSGDNLLDGGAGADTMRGGAGDDTYVVDDSGDGNHRKQRRGSWIRFAAPSASLSATTWRTWS